MGISFAALRAASFSATVYSLIFLSTIFCRASALSRCAILDEVGLQHGIELVTNLDEVREGT
eukprot:scaffold12031_cov157-Isochrysis_galbana.AAC.1